MPYLGQSPKESFDAAISQTITGTGATAYSLTRAVNSPEELEVFINNVQQQPTASYTVSGSTITFDEALDANDSCYVIFRSVTQTTRSVTSSTINDGAVTSSKLASGAAVANIGTGGINTAQIANDAIDNTKLDLTGDYTLTGDIRTPNGFDLLHVYDQTSADVAYDTDTQIHNFGTHVNTYKQFLVHTHLINTSGGGMHVYFEYRCANTNQQIWEGQITGGNHGGGTNTPFQGQGSYIRTAYRLDNGHMMSTKQLISNPKGLTNQASYHSIMFETSWYYQSTGSAHAQGMARATGTGSPTSLIHLNVDPSDGTAYTGAGNARVYSLIWGVSKI